MDLAHTRVSTLRAAAKAWRQCDVEASGHLARSGWFKWLGTEPNMSLHDRIDEMVNEIERLRRTAGEPA